MATKTERYSGNILWILGVWTFLIALGSGTGYLMELTPKFIIPAVIILFIVLIVPYFRDNKFKKWISDIGLRRLTAFHAWRIFAAFIFFTYFRNGELPETFVCFAGWGDLIVGFLAALAVALPSSVMRYSVLHAIGLLELVISVSVGATLLYSGVGSMENLMTLPASLIILLGVPVSAAVHIYALDLMKKARVGKK